MASIFCDVAVGAGHATQTPLRVSQNDRSGQNLDCVARLVYEAELDLVVRHRRIIEPGLQAALHALAIIRMHHPAPRIVTLRKIVGRVPQHVEPAR